MYLSAPPFISFGRTEESTSSKFPLTADAFFSLSRVGIPWILELDQEGLQFLSFFGVFPELFRYPAHLLE